MPKKVYLFHRIDFKSCAIIKKAIVSIGCYRGVLWNELKS